MSVPKPAVAAVKTKTASPVVTTVSAVKTKVANPTVSKSVGVAVKAPMSPAAPVAVKNTHIVAGSDTSQPAQVGAKSKTVTTSPVTAIGAATNSHAVYK
jgi:hypothetical protein